MVLRGSASKVGGQIMEEQERGRGKCWGGGGARGGGKGKLLNRLQLMKHSGNCL